ncbi:MAG: hypothetical protein QM315_11040 [Bacillota bacterium]|nr:hypothetical protein [Bacillota bacterium]
MNNPVLTWYLKDLGSVFGCCDVKYILSGFGVCDMSSVTQIYRSAL